jgi:hypothetical protein
MVMLFEMFYEKKKEMKKERKKEMKKEMKNQMTKAMMTVRINDDMKQTWTESKNMITDVRTKEKKKE